MTDLFGNPEKFFPAREIKTPDFSTFVSFDIETTGLGRNAEIIEIGAVKVVNGQKPNHFNELVRPSIAIPQGITRLTGIDDTMTANADKISEVLPRFRDFTDNNILVGHNIVCFDCRVMGHWADEYGIYIGNDIFDTLRYVKYRCEPFPGMTSHRLSYLCDYFNISATQFHRAAADAEVTAELYLVLQQRGIQKK